MNGFGGMISVVIRGGLESATNFLEKTKLFSLAENIVVQDLTNLKPVLFVKNMAAKHYLNEKVATKFAEVKAPEWEIATFLPLAQFEKATKQKIYADSRKML